MNPITYDECVIAMKTLLAMHPEPNFRNRRETHRVLCERLMTLPSSLSLRSGHRDMAEYPYVYAALGEQQWTYPANPDRRAPIPAHRLIRADEHAQIIDGWQTLKETWDTLQNVHRAAFAALCKAVPVDYHSNPITGAAQWTINMTLHKIFASLDPYCWNSS